MPDSPQAIDLRVVEVKHRIAGADVGIPARVPADGIVAPAVQAERELEEVGEGFEVVVVGDEGDDIGRFGCVGEEERDVAFQAAGVVVQSASVADSGSVGGGAEIDDVVGEGTGVDAAASCPWRDGEVDAEGADIEDGVRDGETVAAHGVDGAIELFRFPRIFVCQRPVPVWLRTGVAAFCAQQLVVDVGIVAVPVEEGTLSILVSGYLLSNITR